MREQGTNNLPSVIRTDIRQETPSAFVKRQSNRKPSEGIHEVIVNSNYTLLQKIKGTLKQHNVTPSQSHFCEIKLST